MLFCSKAVMRCDCLVIAFIFLLKVMNDVRKFLGYSPPFMTLLNKENVTGRKLIIENNILGGLFAVYTDSAQIL